MCHLYINDSSVKINIIFESLQTNPNTILSSQESNEMLTVPEFVLKLYNNSTVCSASSPLARPYRGERGAMRPTAP